MDIRVLRYFLATAREQNITRAAETLHIAQPSLSKQLMELEHKADMAVAECGKFLLPHTVDLCTVNNHRTAIRHIQRTHDLQQGSFTRSTGAYNADNLPFLYLQVNTPQHLQVTETLRYIL